MWAVFWERYPRKAHETDARKAWQALTGTGVSDIEILAALDAWIAYWELAGTEERYIPHPANWLRKRQWAERTPAPPKAKGKQTTEDLRDFLGDFIAKEDSA